MAICKSTTAPNDVERGTEHAKGSQLDLGKSLSLGLGLGLSLIWTLWLVRYPVWCPVRRSRTFTNFLLYLKVTMLIFGYRSWLFTSFLTVVVFLFGESIAHCQGMGNFPDSRNIEFLNHFRGITLVGAPSRGQNQKIHSDSCFPCRKTPWHRFSSNLENFLKIRFFDPKTLDYPTSPHQPNFEICKFQKQLIVRDMS